MQNEWFIKSSREIKEGQNTWFFSKLYIEVLSSDSKSLAGFQLCQRGLQNAFDTQKPLGYTAQRNSGK